MSPTRLISLASLATALALACGCATPAPVKEASANLNKATAALGTAYQTDVAALHVRLQSAQTAIGEYRKHLATSAENQREAANRLTVAETARLRAEALNKFDQEARSLLTTEFETAYNEHYLARLRPTLTRLEQESVEAQQEYKNDSAQAARVKAYAVAALRLAATRRQALEDYRKLLMEASAAIESARITLVNRIDREIAFGAPNTPANDPVREDSEVDLTQGIEARRLEVLSLINAISTAQKELDNYLQTNGWNTQIIHAFLEPFIGDFKTGIGSALEKLETKSSDGLAKILGNRSMDGALQLLRNNLQSRADEALNSLKTSLAAKFNQLADQTTKAIHGSE